MRGMFLFLPRVFHSLNLGEESYREFIESLIGTCSPDYNIFSRDFLKSIAVNTFTEMKKEAQDAFSASDLKKYAD